MPYKRSIINHSPPQGTPTYTQPLDNILEPLLSPRRNSPQILINLPRPRAEYKTNNRLPRHADVLKPTENMNLLAGQHDTGACGILYRELGFPVRTCDTSNSTREMVSLEGLDIFDLEGFDVPISSQYLP